MLKNLPDIMYFGSPKQVNELSGRVFLTPHMRIASLFTIDLGNLRRLTMDYSYNVGSCNGTILTANFKNF